MCVFVCVCVYLCECRCACPCAHACACTLTCAPQDKTPTQETCADSRAHTNMWLDVVIERHCVAPYRRHIHNIYIHTHKRICFLSIQHPLRIICMVERALCCLLAKATPLKQRSGCVHRVGSRASCGHQCVRACEYQCVCMSSCECFSMCA